MFGQSFLRYLQNRGRIHVVVCVILTSCRHPCMQPRNNKKRIKNRKDIQTFIDSFVTYTNSREFLNKIQSSKEFALKDQRRRYSTTNENKEEVYITLRDDIPSIELNLHVTPPKIPLTDHIASSLAEQIMLFTKLTLCSQIRNIVLKVAMNLVFIYLGEECLVISYSVTDLTF